MAISEVAICNNALAMLGANSIRSFDEDNKRARLCKNLYEVTRDLLLRSYDWPFARGFANLQQLDTEDVDKPEGMNVFVLPADCLRARDVHPRGSHTPWDVAGNYVFSPLSSIGLYYTRKEVSTTAFSSTFSSALALTLAYKLAPSLTQDSSLARALFEQVKMDVPEMAAVDANEGNDYVPFDTNPDYDPFVTGVKYGPISAIQDTEAEDAR